MSTREQALEAALREARTFLAECDNVKSDFPARIDAALALPPDTRVERLCEALREVSDDCVTWIDGVYAGHTDNPTRSRRYKRDMGPVNRARALIAEIEAGGPPAAKETTDAK